MSAEGHAFFLKPKSSSPQLSAALLTFPLTKCPIHALREMIDNANLWWSYYIITTGPLLLSVFWHTGAFESGARQVVWMVIE